jgi:hypothetical protein
MKTVIKFLAVGPHTMLASSPTLDEIVILVVE